MKTAFPKYLLSLNELAKVAGKKALSSLKEGDILSLPGHQKGVSTSAVKKILKKKGVSYAPKVIAHINLRGGVGKTTCTVTSATRAVQYGFKTCILDLDMQASASLGFGILLEEEEPVFCDVWQKPEKMLPQSLKELEEGFFILPSSLENNLADSILSSSPTNQKNAVRNVCSALFEREMDLVMIDCPPSLGVMVVSAICAADVIVIPVGSDACSFRGLQLALSEITSISNAFGLKVPEVKILFTKLDTREKLSQKTIQRLQEEHSDFASSVSIRTSTAFPKAFERQETVFASHRKSTAKDDYDRYVRELLNINLVKK